MIKITPKKMSRTPIIFPIPIFSFKNSPAINIVQIYVILPRGTTIKYGNRCNKNIFRDATKRYKKPPKYKNLFVRILIIVLPSVDFFKKKLAKEAVRVIMRINT